MSSPSKDPTIPALLVIEAGRSEAHYWRDLWRYRELFYFLTWRDLIVRYKQTAVGIAWVLLQPALSMVVFTFFGRLLGVPTGGVPRPVLVYTALLPWQFFAAALAGSSGSLVSNANLISKIYFPRLIVPVGAAAVNIVDFVISAGFLAVLMAIYGVWPDARVLLLPVFVLVAFGTALGAGLWLAALNVKYRDFRYVVPFIIQFGLYASPVFFNSTIVPERWRFWYALNPMVGVIDGFRWALLGGKVELQLPSLLLSLAIMAGLLASGVWFFRRIERSFADLI
jgi:lipopolysaccharide transport system permease protein